MIVPVLQHADVWRGIDRLAAKHGLSASGLARRAGLDPTAFNPSKRITREGRPRWPSTESLAKILTVTGEALVDFVQLTGPDDAGQDASHPGNNAAAGHPAAGRSGAVAFDQPAGEVAARSRQAARTIPLISLQHLAAPGCFDGVGQPAGPGWGQLDFPGSIGGDAFAIEVTGGDLEPVYRDGDMLVASRTAGIRRGDRVVLVTRGAAAMIRKVARQDADGIHVEALRSNAQAHFIPQGQLQFLARIVWASQ